MQQYLGAQTSALSDFVGHINPNAEALPLDTLSTAVPSPSNSPAPTGDASTTGMAVLLASMHGFISQHLTQTMTQLMTINNIASAVSLYQTEVTSYAQAVQQYGAAGARFTFFLSYAADASDCSIDILTRPRATPERPVGR